MAALAGLRTETAPLRALRRAVQFAELLTVVGTFAPATDLAARVTRRAVPFGRGEVVRVPVVGFGV